MRAQRDTSNSGKRCAWAERKARTIQAGVTATVLLTSNRVKLTYFRVRSSHIYTSYIQHIQSVWALHAHFLTLCFLLLLPRTRLTHTQVSIWKDFLLKNRLFLRDTNSQWLWQGIVRYITRHWCRCILSAIHDQIEFHKVNPFCAKANIYWSVHLKRKTFTEKNVLTSFQLCVFSLQQPPTKTY